MNSLPPALLAAGALLVVGAGLLLAATEAKAQSIVSVEVPENVTVRRGYTSYADVTVVVSNPTNDTQTVRLSSASSAFSVTPAGVPVPPNGTASARFNVSVSGYTSAGAHVMNAALDGHPGPISRDLVVVHPTELAVSVAPPVHDVVGAGQTATFDVVALERWGWNAVTGIAFSPVACEAAVPGASAVLAQSRTSLPPGSGALTLATVSYTLPQGANPDTWRHSTILCSSTLTYTQLAGAPPVLQFRVNPFFPADLRKLDADSNVSMRRGESASVSLGLTYTNRLPQTVRVAVTYPSKPYVTFPAPQTYDFAPGARGGFAVPVGFSPQTPPGTYALRADLRVTDLAGNLLQTGHASLDVVVAHPARMVLSVAAPTYPLPTGARTAVSILASEVYGWRDIAITGRSFSCSPDVAAWSPEVVPHAYAASAGSNSLAIADLALTLPTAVDASTWRGRTIACVVTMQGSEGPPASVGVTLDPLIPAALAVQFPAAAQTFVFDQPRAEGSNYTQRMEATVTNWGEQGWSGRLAASATGECAFQWMADAQATVPAEAGAPRAVTVPGILSVPSTLPREGACSAATLAAGSVAAPIAGAPSSRSPAFTVSYRAGLAADASVDMGNALLGVRASAPISLRERLGYLPLTLRPVVEPVSDSAKRLPPDLVPALPREVSLAPEAGTSVTVSFTSDARTPPGCEISWRVRWDASPAPAGFAAPTTLLTVHTTLGSVDEASASLRALGLTRPGPAADLLDKLAHRGCGLAPEDIEAAQRVLQAVGALQEGSRLPAASDAAALKVAARRVAPLGAFLGAATPPRHEALDVLSPKYEEVRARLVERADQEVRRLADAPRTPAVLAQLADLSDALAVLAADASAAKAAEGATRAALQADQAEAIDALERLFDLRLRTPVGYKLAEGLAVNLDPFGWERLHRLEAERDQDAARAAEAFADYPPVLRRLEMATAEADESLRLAALALAAGSVVDAFLGAALVVGVVRAATRYVRDVHEVGVGAEFMG